MNINIIRSRRKTICAEIRDGEITVRAPVFARDSDIRDFLEHNGDRIGRLIKKAEERERLTEGIEPLSDAELAELAETAAEIIPERVGYYASVIGVTYGKITVRRQRTRWGSCSAKGNLSFNCLLMLAPAEVLDSVIVHELCHRKVMDHSKKFYAEVTRAYPDYRKWNRWLRDNGAAVMKRLPQKITD